MRALTPAAVVDFLSHARGEAPPGGLSVVSAPPDAASLLFLPPLPGSAGSPPSGLPPGYFFAIVKEMATRDYLGEFELTVMLALLRVGDAAYGVPIAREIEAGSGREASLASVYAALERLERKGLVTSRRGEPTPQRGGRAKKFFHPTPLGLRQVRKTQKALIRLWQGIPQLAGGPS